MSTFTYGDLLHWAQEKLTTWQRDALRRILRGRLSQADVEELAAMAKAASGIKPGSAPTPVPATDADIRPASSPTVAVSLLSLYDIKNVNALAPGPIIFSADGLTVVYGDNASGKSGVARILKKAGHARDPGSPIQPCIFDPDPGQPASATIDFRVGATNNSFSWIDGRPTNNELKQINIFDARCAAIQVENDNRLAYTPEILHVFQDLAIALQAVSATIRSEIEALDKEHSPEIREIPLDPNTAAFRLISNISAQSPLKDVDSICDVTDEDRKRVTALKASLNDNLSGQVALLEAQGRAVKEVDDTLTSLHESLSDQALEKLEKTIAEAAATAEGAEAARTAFAKNSALPGIGSSAWKALWESARRYSQAIAYPGQNYPVTDVEALCLLCQQPIAKAASERLNSFEQFVQSDTQRRADDMRRALDEFAGKLRSIIVPASRTLLGKAAIAEPGLRKSARDFLVIGKIRRRHALRKTRGIQVGNATFPARPDLTATRALISQKIAQLRAAANAAERRKMQDELKELEDRLKIEPHKNAIKREIARLGHRRLLERARTDCDTRWITRQAGEVAKLIVTSRLRSAFVRNLNCLGFNSAPVDVKLGAGSAGQYPYRVSLIPREDIPPAEILSEGERTCVALAGFLAELETSQNFSSIVLDDPISSLDHHYRVRVAILLAECAKHRQVVVFTHDLVFLFMIRKYARAAGTSLRECSLRRGASRHGIPEEGPPWIAMTVNKRIGFLRNELQAAAALLRKGDRTAYEQKAELIYKRLRETWERAVEEVLLDGVVVRFTDGVSTQKLKNITDIRDPDVQMVDTQMSYCSSFVHDESGAVNAGIPDPPAIGSDIDRLDGWATDIKNRRK